MVRLTLSRVRMLKGVLLIGLIRASFDNNKSYVHAWLVVLFLDSGIVVGGQTLYLIHLNVTMCLCNPRHNSMCVVCIYL